MNSSICRAEWTLGYPLSLVLILLARSAVLFLQMEKVALIVVAVIVERVVRLLVS